MEVKSNLEKVISGGQTGADQAALEAAEKVGLKTGGVAPQNFITSQGRQPDLGSRFGLKDTVPVNNSSYGLIQAYITRSMLNVDHSDATIAIRTKRSKGTDQTIRYCHTGKWGHRGPGIKNYKPCLVISDLQIPFDSNHSSVKAIITFIREHKVTILNIAGHRNDQSSGLSQFQDLVKELLIVSFQQLT